MEARADLVETSRLAARRWRMVVILGALTAIPPFTNDMYLPAFPFLTRDLQSSASMTQLTLTASLLGLALGHILFGPLSDRHGRRMPLLVAMSIYAVSSLASALVGSIESLIFLRVLQGCSAAAGAVISRACVRDLYSGAEMTRIFSMLMLVMGLAPVIAPVFGGLLLEVVDWRGIFVTLFTIGVAALLATGLALPETLPGHRRAHGGVLQAVASFRSQVTDRFFLGYGLSRALVWAAMFAYIAGSPFVLQEIFGLSPQQFSLVFATNAVGIILASQITGRMAGRIGERTLLIGGLVLAMAGGLGLVAAVLLGAGLVPLLCALFVSVSSVGVVNIAATSLAMENQAHAAGSASALLGLFQFIVSAIAAPLAGLGGSKTALPMSVTLAACTLAAGLVYGVMIFGGSRLERTGDEGSATSAGQELYRG